MLGFHGKGDLTKLQFCDKPIDLLVRKDAHNEMNERRSRTNKQGTWFDKVILCKMKTNSAFQDVEKQVEELYESITKYLLGKGARSLLINAMKEGMNSQKLVKILEKDDADYWKMLKSIEPTMHMMASLDEVLCDEGIKYVIKSELKDELKQSFDEMNTELKTALYDSGNLPLETEALFG